MNARVELKAVEVGKDVWEVERIARAIEHTIVCHRAVPAYPENAEIRAEYWKRYQELCGEMLGALHG